jgi:hypothetical protein
MQVYTDFEMKQKHILHNKSDMAVYVNMTSRSPLSSMSDEQHPIQTTFLTINPPDEDTSLMKWLFHKTDLPSFSQRTQFQVVFNR